MRLRQDALHPRTPWCDSINGQPHPDREALRRQWQPQLDRDLIERAGEAGVLVAAVNRLAEVLRATLRPAAPPSCRELT